MLRINWVNPDTLRHSLEPTGLLGIGQGRVEIQIELLGSGGVHSDWITHVESAHRLLESVLEELGHIPEPEPEIPSGIFIPSPFEPDPEEPCLDDFQ